MREFETKGIIYFSDQKNLQYNICTIIYIVREDESFEYRFYPVYSVIDLIEDNNYQGIAGLSLDKRKDCYIRKNMTPTFISERSPSSNREDLWALLAEANMEYLNKLEWIIKTNKSYTGDKLKVKEYPNPSINNNLKKPELYDKFVLDNMNQISNSNDDLIKHLLNIITNGASIKINDFFIDDTNRKENYLLFNTLYSRIYKKRKQGQKTGIANAQNKIVYPGRKKMKIDPFTLENIIKGMDSKKITEKQALKILNISRSTLYRRIKKFKEENN
jgi:hypothetical protein